MSGFGFEWGLNPRLSASPIYSLSNDFSHSPICLAVLELTPVLEHRLTGRRVTARAEHAGAVTVERGGVRVGREAAVADLGLGRADPAVGGFGVQVVAVE